PQAIRAFATRNAVRLTHERFSADVDGLVLQIRRRLEEVKNAAQMQEDARPILIKQQEENIGGGLHPCGETRNYGQVAITAWKACWVAGPRGGKLASNSAGGR